MGSNNSQAKVSNTTLQISQNKEEEEKLEREGFTKVDGNLNSGTSGPREFLWYKKGDKSVTRIQFSFMDDMNEGLITNGFTKINKNINTGTKGDPIYLWYMSGATEFDFPIMDLKLTTQVEDESRQFLSGWERLGCDLNRNNSGDPVYLWVKRDTTTYISNITASLSFSEDKSLFKQGYIRVDEDTNRGAKPPGSAVFLWYQRSKGKGDGITDISVSLNEAQEAELQKNGYTKVDEDLNKGATGDPVYLWYMRSQNPAISFLTMLVGYEALRVYINDTICKVVGKNLNNSNDGDPLQCTLTVKITTTERFV